MLPQNDVNFNSNNGTSYNNSSGSFFTFLTNWSNSGLSTMTETWAVITESLNTTRSNEPLISSVESLCERQAFLMGGDTPKTTKEVINLLFPKISFKRSIVWLSIVQIVVYIITVFYGSENLAPSDRTLRIFGGIYGPDVRKGELWRVVTPIFLHGGFFHLTCNLFVILHLGLNLENKYGAPQFLILYFLSGIWGNLLTALMSPCVLAVGASTSGFGICGALMTEVIIAWRKLSKTARKIYGANIFVFIGLCVYLCFVPSVDMWGHIGGLIVGIVWTVYENQKETIPKYILIFICVKIISKLLVHLYDQVFESYILDFFIFDGINIGGMRNKSWVFSNVLLI